LNYELFFQLIEFVPNLKILQIGNSADIAQELSQKLKECDGVIDIVTDKEIEIKSNNINQKIKDYNSELKLDSRQYENVIVCDVFDKLDNPKEILTTCYHALENSAELAILINNNSMLEYRLKEILDEIEYRAINSFELSDEYTVITAKKLHMWGNGL
jgi:hypothetical protein